MSKSRQFYAQLLSISKSNLVETSFSELEKLTGNNIFYVSANISALKKIGVIESFINCKAYNKKDDRIFIGFALPEIIDDLFRKGDSKNNGANKNG